jgi:hypothetical protein
VFSLHQEIVMIATAPEQRASTRANNPLRDRFKGTRQHSATSAVRADRADARWTVRVVLEADTAMATVLSVRAIVFDRDSGTSVLHTSWSEWQDIPLLVTHVPASPLTEATMATAAASLADALLALLGPDAAACLTALHAGDVPPPLSGISRRERQYRQIVRDAAWHDPRATGGPNPVSVPGRTDMSEAEAAQRTLNGQLSGQADRARGDS